MKLNFSLFHTVHCDHEFFPSNEMLIKLCYLIWRIFWIILSKSLTYSDQWTEIWNLGLDGAFLGGATKCNYFCYLWSATLPAVPRHFGKKFDPSEQPRVTLGGAIVTFINRNYCGNIKMRRIMRDFNHHFERGTIEYESSILWKSSRVMITC